MYKPKIGDTVEYELASNSIYDDFYGEEEPRWNYSNDNGSSGRFIRTEVVSVYSDFFSIKVNGRNWNVPLPEHHDFPIDAEGFPRIVKEKKKKELIQKDIPIIWFK